MKEFRKTLFAKTADYILHVLAVIVFIASIVAEATFFALGLYAADYVAVYQNLLIHYWFEVAEEGRIFWLLRLADQMKYWMYAVTAVSFVIAVISLCRLIATTGRKPGDDELHIGVLDKIYTDIFVLIFIAIYTIYGGIAVGLADIIHYPDSYQTLEIAGLVLTAIACIITEPFFFMGMAIRVKDKSFFKNTATYKCCKLVWKATLWVWKQIVRFIKFIAEAVKSLPLLWRTVVVVSVVSFAEFLGIVCFWYGNTEFILFLWFVEKLILVPVIIYAALTLRKLEEAGKRLAGGDLTYRLDLKGLYWLFRNHGENLNSISTGMKNAVEKELKSERMKTELITNVSHDIKTPLTSIINYATLINEEVKDEGTVKEYAEVLVRQSDRLKRLLEDLVEASKASTGNIDVELVPCDPSIFVTQADGEYSEKNAKADLKLVTKVPDEDVTIMADGRRMWRVFDNLMNNICKYALPGTRVYLSLDITDKEAVFSFKNTSRDQLDITEMELMERFVRGDKSRNTEGNGLGLSIAKSMAEVQGGKLDISIDGDLFKATARFPIV